MDRPQDIGPHNINVGYYISILNRIIEQYRMRLDIMARRNKVIDDFLKNFTRDEVRGISKNAFDTSLVNSRRALAEMKQLLEEDREVIRSIRGEEKEEETILGKAIEDLDYAIKFLNSKNFKAGKYGQGHYIAPDLFPDKNLAAKIMLENKGDAFKKRLRKDKINIHNFKDSCKAARNLFDHIEKNMNDIDHRLQLEEIFLKNPNRDTFAIFVKQWREEVKKELELRKSIIIFMRKHKVPIEGSGKAGPISLKVSWDIAKRSGPGLIGSGVVGSQLGETAAALGIGATLITATIWAFRDLKRVFDEIEKTAEISSEKLITSLSGIERKHWWDRRFG